MIKSIYRIFFLVVISLGGISFTSAQKPAKAAYKSPDSFDFLGMGVLRCIYEYDVHDPILKKSRFFTQILLTMPQGKTLYEDYDSFKIDSTFVALGARSVTSRIMGKVYAQYNNDTQGLIILRNYKAPHSITTQSNLFVYNYEYTEEQPRIEWTETGKSKMVCDYSCKQAVGDFRGRKWTVWYAPDIPVAYGPWKLGGLPGLILAATDATGEHKFEAISIGNAQQTSVVKRIRSKTAKTNRKTFMRKEKDYCMNPRAWVEASGLVTGNTEGITPRLFYNPLELE